MLNQKLALLLIVPAYCSAADNRPASSLTAEEMQDTYNVAINRVSEMLKAPLTAHYAPIENAVFSTGRNDYIHIRLNVDAQNSYGAMLRRGWWCKVKPRGTSGIFSVACFPGLGFMPKDAVRFSQAAQQRPATSDRSTSAPQSDLNSKPDAVLVTINVQSSPAEAFVEVDGYPAGKTPVDVKLAKGEYLLKVSKTGFQTYTQKLMVEPGKAQSVGIALAATTSPSPAGQSGRTQPVVAPPVIPPVPPKANR